MVLFHKNFKKKYKNYSKKMQNQIDERLLMFAQNPFNPILKNHPLHGEFEGFFSINISGDIRAVYAFIDDDIIKFTDIGTHTELYD